MQVIGRTLGIDLGSKRIGIATCDRDGTLASPLTVLNRSGSLATDHRRISDLATEEEAVRVVVGVPLAMSGEQAIAASAVLEEISKMAEAIVLPIETWDERLTTAAAHKAMKAQNISGRRRRDEVDKWAAALILQGWLDSHRHASAATV